MSDIALQFDTVSASYNGAIAALHGVSLTVRAGAFAALLGANVPVTRRPPVEKALLAQALGQLGKIGSNINQIAHRSHMGRDPMEGLMEAELAQLRLVRDAIMGALGRDY